MGNLNSLEQFSESLPNSGRMPLLFLSHWSPMNAIEGNEFVAGFRNVAKTLPKPIAIICVSAHWFTNGTKVTAMSMPETIHDFGGFPQALFEVQYPVKGNPVLTKATKFLLEPTLVALDEKWGLDHGAWSVLRHLYPNADIPVIQLSIDYTKAAQYHFELAQKLRKIWDKGVLIIGSGNIVHNLGLVDLHDFQKDDYGFDWAIEARSKFNGDLLDGDFQSLIDYKKQSKAVQLAIPTPEHYLPLIYTLGLKQKKRAIAV